MAMTEDKKTAPARVVFADDDDVLRELLRSLLGFLSHVTVVGEATNGVEAVQLVAQHYPDTVLLDVNMPRLDGFGAAEVIRSFRPQTRLLLHTADPDPAKRKRAEQLGVPLLDKLQLHETADLVEEYAVSDRHPLAHDIEPLVLLALAGGADGGVLVVKADESIPFYNPAVASVLDLPFPPERVTLDDLRTRGVLGLRADGSPYPLDEQPLARALTDRKPVADVVYLRGADGDVRPYTMTSLPFFGPDGELIGVGNYVTDARPPDRPATAST
ncbi:MAG: response regulator [Gaiellaceae bacterium]